MTGAVVSELGALQSADNPSRRPRGRHASHPGLHIVRESEPLRQPHGLRRRAAAYRSGRLYGQALIDRRLGIAVTARGAVTSSSGSFPRHDRPSPRLGRRRAPVSSREPRRRLSARSIAICSAHVQLLAGDPRAQRLPSPSVSLRSAPAAVLHVYRILNAANNWFSQSFRCSRERFARTWFAFCGRRWLGKVPIEHRLIDVSCSNFVYSGVLPIPLVRAPNFTLQRCPLLHTD